MIKIKNSQELISMRDAGKITGEALLVGGEAVMPGVTTKEIDTKIRKFIEKCGARPTFLGYGGFPGSACISVNEQVIHGIPSDRVLCEGDIVKIDVGAFYKGFTGDCAATFAVGEISNEARELIKATEESFYEAMKVALPGNRIGDIGNAVESHVAGKGYSVVRKFVGHGVGRELHEDPEVPNFGKAGHGIRLVEGMTIAVEPMVNVGTGDVVILKDGWTVLTADKKLSAHYEHSVAISDNGPILLTKV